MAWFGLRRRREDRRASSADGATVDASGRFFRVFGGRRHVAGVPYTLPKDDQEVNRLDFQHFLLRYALRGNYVAPVDRPLSILDVGTGTGRWAVEMATLFPDADVIGLDVVPPPADETSLGGLRPPNYTFVTGNVLEGLPFADASFGLVHQRLLVGAVPAERWPGVVQELVRVTQPGGWVELVEANIKVERGGPALDAIGAWIYAGVAQRGIQVALCDQVGRMLQEAGLAGVAQREVHLPLGKGHGRVGTMMETNHFALFESLKGLIVAMGVTDAATYDQAVQAARAEVDRGRCSVAFYLAYGRRVA